MKKGKINIDYTEYETNIPEKIDKRHRNYRANINKKMIKAFIPGIIKGILVKEKEKVVTGQKLLILEAMKMENEILSPVNGIIKKIHINIEDKVGKDQLLIEIE